jgi:hypothetical protein|tara:strand:+ start:1933 stop:2178 length:246 start_codon:yes stop_codon:yes gene_type:complete
MRTLLQKSQFSLIRCVGTTDNSIWFAVLSGGIPCGSDWKHLPVEKWDLSRALWFGDETEARAKLKSLETAFAADVARNGSN